MDGKRRPMTAVYILSGEKGVLHFVYTELPPDTSWPE